MPAEAAENEPGAHQPEREDSDFSFNTKAVRRLLGAAACVYLIFLFYGLWQYDEVKLHTLHSITRMLQTSARVLGLWALEFENAYNEYVDALH